MGSGILVLCEHENGKFKKTSFELLGKAAELAAGIGGAVVAGVVGAAGDAASLGAYGASAVFVADGAALSTHTTGPLARAVQALVAAAKPAVVLAPASTELKDALPRLAARIGAGLGSEVTGLRVDGGKVVGRRPVYAGKALVDVSIQSEVAFFTVRPNSFPVPAPGAGQASVQSVSVSFDSSDLVSQLVGREASTAAVADLTEADRIVSGGRSVKTKDGYDKLIRPLANAIGATPGASRACVDAGFAPHSHQVGQTGKVVNPSLYVAMGISGAIQHLAGMRTSRVIVAVNTDKEAPIFQHATYGIVGDMFEVGPALQREFEAALR
jgi:electron transfer flavoprotein alpha subunit